MTVLLSQTTVFGKSLPINPSSNSSAGNDRKLANRILQLNRKLQLRAKTTVNLRTFRGIKTLKQIFCKCQKAAGDKSAITSEKLLLLNTMHYEWRVIFFCDWMTDYFTSSTACCFSWRGGRSLPGCVISLCEAWNVSGCLRINELTGHDLCGIRAKPGWDVLHCESVLYPQALDLPLHAGVWIRKKQFGTD